MAKALHDLITHATVNNFPMPNGWAPAQSKMRPSPSAGIRGSVKNKSARALGHEACRDDRRVLCQRVPRLLAHLALAYGAAMPDCNTLLTTLASDPG
jgi:hypothetical protein